MRDPNEKPHEYDDYSIPPYDPTISEEERKRLKEEAHKELLRILEEIKKK